MTMTHLKIIQNNNVIEEVTSSLITKLYDIAHAGLDVSSNLQGRLHVTKAYGDEIDWLTSTYTDLYINADYRYFRFQDKTVNSIIGSNYGDGIGILESQLSSITDGAFGYNFQGTDIKTFDELNRLTGITKIYHAFTNCSNLESINLENITEISPIGGLGDNNLFYGCTNLFKDTGIVHMPKLTLITGKCFQGCSYIKMFIAENLENAYKSSYPFGDTAIEAYIAPKLDKSNLGTLKLIGDYYHSNNLVGCSTLKVLEVGKIDRIEKQAFRQYSSLTAIVLHQQDTIVTLNGYSSGDSFDVYFPNQNVKIYVPDSMVASYQADSVWSNFTSHIAPISEYDFSDHISDSSLISYYDSVFNSSAS